MILAGIDEAGYGPMLGPFVVSAAVFRAPVPSEVPSEVAVPVSEDDADRSTGVSNHGLSGEGSSSAEGPTPDLWALLGPTVSRKPGPSRIPVNDSKKLYQRRGLQHLEEGLLPFLVVRDGDAPKSLRRLLQAVAKRGRAQADEYLDEYPWYRDRDVPLPHDTYSGVIRKLATKLETHLSSAGVEFLGLAATPMEVLEWNGGLAAHENKSTVAFHALAGFLRRLWTLFPDEDVEVVIDRQGGRVQYSRPLYDAVRPQSVRIETQDGDTSTYSLLRRRRTSAAARSSFRVTFTKESEEKSLCVALASMLSKYLRELHMIAFNAYWAEHATELRPTAGYVQDARRFLRDTAELRARLGIDSKLLVRQK